MVIETHGHPKALVHVLGLHACKAAKPFLDCGLRKVITTGANTFLWYDNWTFNGTLRSQFIGPLNSREKNQLVSPIIDIYGNWNFQLSFDLLDNILKLIQAIPTNIASHEDDLFAWAFTNEGNYSLQTAYNAAKGLNVLNPTTSPLSWIWKLKVPPIFILFI